MGENPSVAKKVRNLFASKSKEIKKSICKIIRYLTQFLYLIICVQCACASESIPSAERWQQISGPIVQRADIMSDALQFNTTAVAEDSEGFLWIGTYNGLTRWDGYRSRSFFRGPDSEGALPDSNIQALYSDLYNHMWIGTGAGGLSRYDPESDRFINYQFTRKPSSDARIQAITSENADTLLIGTRSGLAQFDIKSGRITHVESTSGNLQLATGVRALLRDNNGSLWIGCEKGLLRRPSNSSRFEQIEIETPSHLVPRIFALFQSSDGHVWIGSSEGAYVLRANEHVARMIEGPKNSTLSNIAVRTITEANDGEIWLGTGGQGIVAINSATMRARDILANQPQAMHDALTQISTLYRDHAGQIWIGSSGLLYLAEPRKTGMITLFGNSASHVTLPTATFSAILPMNDGTVWLGTSEKGISIIDPYLGSIETIRADNRNPKHALPEHYVTALVATPQGKTYIGFDTGGLYQSIGPHHSISKIRTANIQENSNINDMILGGNTLWIGTSDGLAAIDIMTNRSLDVSRYNSALSATPVWTFGKAPDGAIWVGARNGLRRIDPITGSIKTIEIQPHAEQVSSDIREILWDNNGRLWVGTADQIYYADPVAPDVAPRFERLSLLGNIEGYHANDPIALVGRDDHHVWVNIFHCLVSIDTKDFSMNKWRPADGIQMQQIFTGTSANTDHNELLIGGIGGLIAIAPDKLSKWKYQPNLVVTDAQIGDRVVSAGIFNMSGKVKTLLIPGGANKFSIEFSALDYSAPESNQYAYRLVGIDKDWVTTDSNHRRASYSNLSPGDYRLLLRGSNRSGTWSEAGREIDVQVMPAWYQTWWMRTFSAMLLLSGMFLIVHVRTRYLRAMQKVLEKQVAQRTDELKRNQTALLEANERLSLSAETLRLLSDIGREITANLDAVSIFEDLHHHIEGLVDAKDISIYKFNAVKMTLEPFYSRSGIELPTIPIDSSEATCAVVARELKEILIEMEEENLDSKSPRLEGQRRSALYSPLIANEHLLGVMTIQSDLEHAYGERERLIFRTICAYGAIALENANTHRQLQLAQQQMVLHEKMASLGTLTAGVAHEINNPLNFAHVSAQALELDLQEFHVRLREMAGEDAPDSVTDFISHRINALDSKVGTIVQGTSRIRDLVKDLRIFSRLDDAERNYMRIAKSLRSTLNLVKTEFSDSVHFYLVVDENQELECWPALLNQVFMNLIVNACQAVQAKQKTAPSFLGELHIESKIESGHLVVSFSDNGCGMSELQLRRIFEPFYTTKEVGAGTGLGLSISFGIIEKHHGKIEVTSELNVGSCFKIILPLQI